MGFVQVLLWAGPLAVVLGVATGLCFSKGRWRRKPHQMDKLSTQEIKSIARNQDDLQLLRASIKELSLRGENLNFIHAHVLDMSANTNSVIRITADEILKDFFNAPFDKPGRPRREIRSAQTDA